MLGQKNFVSKKLLCPKITFGPKKLWAQKIWIRTHPNKFGSKIKPQPKLKLKLRLSLEKRFILNIYVVPKKLSII